jgi:hypothetical protein
MPLFGFTVSFVEGVAFGRRLLLRWKASVAGLVRPVAGGVVGAGVLVCALVMSVLWSPSYGARYRQSWPLFADPHRAVLREAVDLVPSGAVTAASYQLVPHLAHRERIYTFPNPWIPSYWGIDVRTESGRVTVAPPPHDPADIEWIAADRRVLSDQAKALLTTLIASGQWETRLAQDDVVVLSRRR